MVGLSNDVVFATFRKLEPTRRHGALHAFLGRCSLQDKAVVLCQLRSARCRVDLCHLRHYVPIVCFVPAEYTACRGKGILVGLK